MANWLSQSEWGLIGIFILLLLLATPLVGILIGFLGLSHSIRFAAKSPCPKCGIPLGSKVIKDSQKRFEERMMGDRSRFPGARFLSRRIACWNFECPQCRTILHFEPGTNNLYE